mgnify:CR=1 FL=1
MRNLNYTTKATWLGKEYGCRIFMNGKLIVEGRCPTKDLIGPTFRDMMRTLDKGFDWDDFTGASRERKYKEGNKVTQVKHYWGGNGGNAV